MSANDFSYTGQCEVHRYFEAAIGAVGDSDHAFNAYRLISDWNKDFLKEQPACN